MTDVIGRKRPWSDLKYNYKIYLEGLFQIVCQETEKEKEAEGKWERQEVKENKQGREKDEVKEKRERTW